MTPDWYTLAEKELGQAEIPGRDHNPRILEYLSVAGFPDVQNDEDAWCAVFANWALISAGHPGTHSRMAVSFLGYGKKLAKPVKGCLVVLKRTSDPQLGHVGFYSHTKDKRVYLLGGNQGNKVSIASFPESDVRAYRMPHDKPKVDRKIVVGTGTTVGTGVGYTLPQVTLPKPPDMSWLTGWRGSLTEVGALATWAGANKGLMVVFGAWILCTLFWTRISSWFQGRST